ncbi:L-serine ammonia-lyase, iron-sulfur-dependent subunit beta [uncultured Metabacillus sp.]|uniref:L-serine ammonia-lyase, iron-sulfur-dependent subunit beta n=1 Tax=Metabacillus sp. Hm71 TaxID=3450743 RepID=UPI00262EA462|nr:L-serine ammonia-lyase, iron-sulfur-dependent subunit beta [uncultured Metabacillus sp.]
MKYKSAFDIIGPIMIGPSSSHTAGAARIGRVARTLFGREPKRAVISLYGSFAKTYKGHGTDVAIVGGLLDFDTFDERIPKALQLAEQAGIEIEFIAENIVTDHPNTVRIQLSNGEHKLDIVGISIGGGSIEITELNSFKLKLSGEYPAILVVHQDRYGAISGVTNILAKYQLNIGRMEVSRKEKGNMAMMVIEVDQKIDDVVIQEIESLPNITQTIRMVE